MITSLKFFIFVGSSGFGAELEGDESINEAEEENIPADPVDVDEDYISDTDRTLMEMNNSNDSNENEPSEDIDE